MAFYYSPQSCSVFKITGSSAERYLHGRTTQDIRSMTKGELRFSLFLNPQGRIEGMCSFFKLEDNFFYMIAPYFSSVEEKETFLSSLLRFKVADQVDIEDVSSSIKVLLSFSDILDVDLESRLQREFHILGHSKAEYVVKEGAVPCTFVLIATSSGEIFTKQDEERIIAYADCLSDDEFEKQRIQRGFPLYYVDITNSTMAPDLPMQSYIAFNKGCYAGQEVVEMATARGKPNKRFVSIKSETALLGSDIYSGSQVVGVITSKILDKGMTCGLGFIKNKEYDSHFYAQGSNEEMLPLTLVYLS